MRASQNAELLRLAFEETQDFSDPCRKWSFELLRLTLDLECRVTQTRVRWDAELLRLVSNAGLLRPTSKVSTLLEMRGPHFSLKRDLHVEVRLASDDLFLMILRQSTEVAQSQWALQSLNSHKCDKLSFYNFLEFLSGEMKLKKFVWEKIQLRK